MAYSLHLDVKRALVTFAGDRPFLTAYCLPILQRASVSEVPMRRPMSRDGGALPAASLCLRSALPATLCFIHLGRSWQREMETKKFHAAFPARLWFIRGKDML